ncbi:hypothetical protein L208DRAFT_1529442 [Tricholoma matsutake]|nr:hypothetical protein L208DRAFT_1529442 [Tricholoma matsutake 945]
MLQPAGGGSLSRPSHTHTRVQPPSTNKQGYRLLMHIHNAFAQLQSSHGLITFIDRDIRINLDLWNLRKLSNQIKSAYQPWVNRSPRAYKADGFFSQRQPICITSRYGQNIEMEFNPDHEAEEIDNWNKECNYADICYVTIAVASHLQLSGQLSVQVRQVEEWVPWDMADIIDEFGDELYTSPVPGQTREQIRPEDLEYLPLLDEDDREIPLFTHNGYQIERRLAAHSEGDKPHGVLMNLRHLNILFDEDGIEEDLELLDDDMEATTVKYHVYLQASLVTAGHFQANGLMTNFQQWLTMLNSAIHQELDAQEDVGGEPSEGIAVRAIACQGYNAVMHSTRGLGSQHHNAQKGYVMAALSGAWANNDQAMETIARCRYLLTILQQIKENVVLFTAEAYPALYSWTMYPLTCIIEGLWKHCCQIMDRKKVDGLHVEMCSITERALNYMHTGNVAVIVTMIMNPLWIGQGIIQDGIPCYNPEMVTIDGSCMIRVDRDMWPYNPKTHQPRTSARTSQLYVYNKTVAKAFYAWLSMGLAPWRWVPPIAQHPNLVCSRAHGIMYSALSMFIEDCTGLVSSKVKTSIKRQLADLEPRIHQVGNSRTWDLALWEHTADPLAWGTDSSHAMQTFALLINILSNDPEVPMNMRQASKHIGYKELALQIVRMLRDEELTPVGAPVRAKGGFLPAMKLAYLMIRQMIKPDVVEKDKVEDYIAVCMSSMMQKMRIQMVPWHKENPMGTTQERAIYHRWWMMMRRKPDDDGQDQGRDQT